MVIFDGLGYKELSERQKQTCGRNSQMSRIFTIEFRLKLRDLELVTKSIGLPCGFQKRFYLVGLQHLQSVHQLHVYRFVSSLHLSDLAILELCGYLAQNAVIQLQSYGEKYDR